MGKESALRAVVGVPSVQTGPQGGMSSHTPLLLQSSASGNSNIGVSSLLEEALRPESVPGRQMEKHVIGDVSAYLAATAPPFPKRIPTGTSEGLTGVHTPLEHHYLHKK